MDKLLFTHLRYLLRLPLALIPKPLLSFVAFKDLFLSLAFLRHRLIPATVDLAGDAANSASIHLWIPSAPRRTKPALLLVHGFGGNAKWQWERQIGPLSRSFDLYIPDLVFFGGSISDGVDRSVGFQARCMAEAMRELGVEKYSVVGISYGGYVAFRVAEMAAEAVERVVILTSGVCTTPEQRQALISREGRDVSEILLPQRSEDLRALLRRSMYRPPKWVPDFILRDFIKVMYLDQRKERVELLKELLERGADLDPLPVLTQETLILWGDQDTVFPVGLAHQLKRHLGERAGLEIIKDAGHALQLEKPERVNHLIEKFLLGANESKPS